MEEITQRTAGGSAELERVNRKMREDGWLQEPTHWMNGEYVTTFRRPASKELSAAVEAARP